MTFNSELYRRLRELGIDNDSAVTLANGQVLVPSTPIGERTNEPTTINIRQGIPYRRMVTLVGGKFTWEDDADYEVRMQVRERNSHTAVLIADLSNKITKNVSTTNDDIVLTLALTGQDTLNLRTGKYDMIISDVGSVDQRAQVLLYGDFLVEESISA